MTNGGPAFPSQTDTFGGGTQAASRGMSLRDYFAAKAMAALIAASMSSQEAAKTMNDYGGALVGIPLAAFNIADAMLAEREKTRP